MTEAFSIRVMISFSFRREVLCKEIFDLFAQDHETFRIHLVAVCRDRVPVFSADEEGESGTVHDPAVRSGKAVPSVSPGSSDDIFQFGQEGSGRRLLLCGFWAEGLQSRSLLLHW